MWSLLVWNVLSDVPVRQEVVDAALSSHSETERALQGWSVSWAELWTESSIPLLPIPLQAALWVLPSNSTIQLCHTFAIADPGQSLAGSTETELGFHGESRKKENVNRLILTFQTSIQNSQAYSLRWTTVLWKHFAKLPQHSFHLNPL